jgi:hypothetical protein
MPSTDWKESAPEGEDARFAAYSEELHALQKKHAASGTTARALHAKGHTGVRASLEVFADLPAHARHGVFAAPRTFDARVRWSNGSGKRQSDRAGDVRGIAVKLLGVAGKKVLAGLEDATTQDFLAIQSSATPFRTADEFMAFVRAAETPLSLVFKLIAGVGLGRALQILARVAGSAGKPVASLAGTAFYSALPIRVGPYAARFAFVPRQATDAAVPDGRGRDYLAEDLRARLAKGPLAYDLRLQFFEDEKTTPIEDASVDWTSPYVDVGRLTIPAQDVTSAAGKALAAEVEAMSFDPWHALVEHAPLGGIMRARKAAYFSSTKERGATKEP